ncbi:hypothetical protein, partial [Alistipes putredinis]|uniref:hypothetical protein n=1 Tax=Alistipes putredinis TaxID=28117 RepID=UPI00242D2871
RKLKKQDGSDLPRQEALIENSRPPHSFSMSGRRKQTLATSAKKHKPQQRNNRTKQIKSNDTSHTRNEPQKRILSRSDRPAMERLALAGKKQD